MKLRLFSGSLFKLNNYNYENGNQKFRTRGRLPCRANHYSGGFERHHISSVYCLVANSIHLWMRGDLAAGSLKKRQARRRLTSRGSSLGTQEIFIQTGCKRKRRLCQREPFHAKAAKFFAKCSKEPNIICLAKFRNELLDSPKGRG